MQLGFQEARRALFFKGFQRSLQSLFVAFKIVIPSMGYSLIIEDL